MSRCLLVTLQSLSDDDIRALVQRALSDERGYAGRVALTADAEAHLLRIAGGDARRALTALEAAAHEGTVDLTDLERAVDRAAVRYDRTGDQHYDVTSAFIKSMRGGDVDAALHYLARMVEAGEDPRFIARRVVILASEDIGMADPSALLVSVAAAQAVAFIGWPEAAITLAQAVIHCSLAPKSNAVVRAIGAAQSDIRAGASGPVPTHLRDAHYAGAKKIEHGHGYRYPHDFPAGPLGGIVAQQYAPDAVADREYYRPSAAGEERAAAERLATLRAALRGEVSGSEPVRANEQHEQEE
jgi:putative ATPase